MTAEQARALVVEDDRSWQQILYELLHDAGLVVDVVDSVQGAIERIRTTPHRVAVVDLALGNGDYDNQDGLRVLAAIRRQDPGCVAVMLTGFATVELAVSALTEYGALTCLRKESFNRVEFRSLIRQALASAPLSSDVEPRLDGTAQDRATVEGRSSPGEVGCGAELALVVDDDAGWRGILSELLVDAGYQVRACSSYGEVLGYLRREAYVVAVVDLALSGAPTIDDAWTQRAHSEELEGYRLLSSTSTAGLPTIVVSGVATAEEIDRAYAEQGIFACLSKQTFDRQAFLQTVEEARAAASLGSELDALTVRERQVLELIARGMTNKEIAESLVITGNTVKRHLKAIFSKLEVHTRSAAAAKAISAGIQAGIQTEPSDLEAHAE